MKRKTKHLIFVSFIIFMLFCFGNTELIQATNSSQIHSMTKTATFEITYVNFPPEAESAFQHAADIWASILVSQVPIKVLVNYTPLPANLRGHGIGNVVKDFPGAPLSNTWYLSSLADAISGADQNPDDYDMDILLNSTLDWYFGLDGKPPSGKFDFVTLALHEMGHCFGFLSLCKVVQVTGSYGMITVADIRTLAFSFPNLHGLPSVFDRHIANGNNQHITDTTLFANSSTALTSQLTNNDLFFNGPEAVFANNGTAPKVFAPSKFIFGKSILHLDDTAFPSGNPNSLMIHNIAFAKPVHYPGTVTGGILKDLGWCINESALTNLANYQQKSPDKFQLQQNYPNPFNPGTTIQYNLYNTSKVVLKIYNTLGQGIRTLVNKRQKSGLHLVRWDGRNDEGLKVESGIYIYRIQIRGKIQSRKMLLIK